LSDEYGVLIYKSFGVVDHFPEVNYVLLETVRHLGHRDETVAVVLVIDALDADRFRAGFAEVLDLLHLVARTRDAVKGAHQDRHCLLGKHEVKQFLVLAAVLKTCLGKAFKTD
jgi:hypothetical protein